MLIIVSDMHLTDGTLAPPVSKESFQLFVTEVEKIVNNSKNKVELIFLGDIFDLLRSKHWLGQRIEEKWVERKVRPWSLTNGGPVGTVLQNIFDGIIKNYGEYFKKL
ncbi:MAG: hypothetical protein KJ739_09800 [Nitrospinae bacterium]|nr:hypothetical protein [Nitrospinota bacterium]